jgi:triacylglycerol esterase/lipase EstA (alpha/beta hydrolase family)
VRPFAYDRRLSNRHSAGLLASRVAGWLDEWRSRPGNATAKVTFVCHSMGGLVTRYYLEILGGRALARRVVTSSAFWLWWR